MAAQRRIGMSLLEHSFANNTLMKWLFALIIAVFGTLALYIISKILARSLRAVSKRMRGDVADIMADTVDHTKVIILAVISVYAGSRVLVLPATLASFLRYLAIILGGIQAGIWLSFFTAKLVTYTITRKGEETELASAAGVVTLLAKVVVWSAVLLLVLDNLGFTITTLVAGLGVGGIAIAMAAQNILSDLFASLSILLDKPFKVGEFVIVGEMLGVVENIGLKTTRIRSLSGEELVFSNSDLLSSRIRNYKTLKERRIVFTIGVEYSTPYEKLKRISQMIRDIIESVDLTRFDRSHFARYGAFSLNFETVYYVLDPDYTKYMDVQQEINLRIFQKFEEEGIVFAFPTQTIHLKQESSVS
jgi:small-conductance mechanosensitive channel